MTGSEQPFLEILRAIGNLEAAYKSQESAANRLDAKLEDIRDKLEEALQSAHDFDEYKKNRQDLPKRVTDVEAIAADYLKCKPSYDALKIRFERAVITISVIYAIMIALIGLLSKGLLRINL
jgi:alkylhydroperoxidase/carboxymuconolactone decarboxylase family protein YurZ